MAISTYGGTAPGENGSGDGTDC